MATPKGLTVSLYTNPRNVRPREWGGGEHVFADVHEVTVVEIKEDGKTRPLPQDSQIFEPDERAPAARLVIRSNIGAHLAPLTDKWTMAGGCYAASCDARWGRLIGIYWAVSVHDRIEH